jgi:pilus assembly protein Flp/PilA
MLSLIATLQTLGLNLKTRLTEEKGATAVEYGIMVALIAVAVIIAVTLLGDNLAAMFNDVAGKVPVP